MVHILSLQHLSAPQIRCHLAARQSPWTQEIHDAALQNVRAKHGAGAAEAFVLACRRLFKAAVEAGWISRNPSANLKPPPRPDSGRIALTESQLRDLFTTAQTTGRDPELDVLVLWFVRITACRRQTLVELTADRVNADDRTIRVTEKNGHTRVLPVTEDLVQALFAHRAERNPDCPRIFHYRDGTCFTDRRLDSLFKRVRDRHPWAKDCGLSLHWLRHTTLTELDRLAGHSIARAFAGHTDGDVTDTYTKATLEDLRYASQLLWGHAA